MRKVQLTIEFTSDCRVSAIRTMRSVTGLGLKEAKDFIDATWSRWSGCRTSEIQLNMAQYGELMLQHSLPATSTAFGCGFVITGLRAVAEQTFTDFSAVPAR